MKTPLASMPFNAQYTRNKRNEAVRWIIYSVLHNGAFEFSALLAFVNYVLKDHGVSGAHELSKNGLASMLGQNCEGAWTYVDGVVSLVPEYSGSLTMHERRRRLDLLHISMQNLISRGVIRRDKGSRYMCSASSR